MPRKTATQESQPTTAKAGADRPWPRWYVYSRTKDDKPYQANTYLEADRAAKREKDLKSQGYVVEVIKKDGPTRAGGAPRKPHATKKAKAAKAAKTAKAAKGKASKGKRGRKAKGA